MTPCGAGTTGVSPFPGAAPWWRKYAAIPASAAVRGAPLLFHMTFQSGPHKGQTFNVLFVTTSDNNVSAFAEEQLLAGVIAPLWTVSLGGPSTKGGSNIPPPVGICGTPVIDAKGRRIFVMAKLADNQFYIHSLSIDTGGVLAKSQLVDQGAPGRPTFDGTKNDQRGALNLVNGWVYATFADFLADDEDVYYGWLIGCNAGALGTQQFFSTTTTVIGGGVWGPGGPAAAPDGSLYVVTGNMMPDQNDPYWNALPSGKRPGDIGDYFIGVVKLVPTATGALPVSSWYQPSDTQGQNNNDWDMGGSSAALFDALDAQGATHQLLANTGKDGSVYLLSRAALGGWAGSQDRIYELFSKESKCGPAHYMSQRGVHYVYLVGGGPVGLASYRIDVPASGSSTLQLAWNAGGGGITLGDFPGSPVVTSLPETDAGATVWIVDDNQSPPRLRAFDALNGAELFGSGHGSDALGGIQHFPPITAAGSSIFVGTQSEIACYTPYPVAHGDTMHPGETLGRNQSITSASGRFEFILQADGNLVLYEMPGGVPLWASGTNGKNVAVCIMQADGNLVLYSPSGDAVWASNTNGNPGSRLVMQNDGNAVIYRPNNTPVWATNTVVPSGPTATGSAMTAGQMLYAGQSIQSASGRFQFIMQADGNLVLYEMPGRVPLWASGTNGKRVAVCAMQGDGNLVLYEAGPHADWASNTNGNPGSRLVVQDDGNVVIYRTNNTAAWATNTVVPSGPTATGSTMTAGQMLYAGQSIQSANGRFQFIMQTDGNLVLYEQPGGVPLWASGTNGKRVAVCAMQGDGNLVLYEAGPHPDWASNTSGNPGSRLVVQDDGNVVIYLPSNSAAWATNTVVPSGSTATGNTMIAGQMLYPGQSIKSPGGKYNFIMQTDGNLVLYQPDGVPSWASGTNGKHVAVCAMQGDGNLVLYEAGPRADWASNTNGNPGSRLVVQDDGNVVIYRTNNTAAWATNTVIPVGPTAAGGTITAGQMLYPGQSIQSASGRFQFIMQTDGNLVLYEQPGGVPLWASGTNGRPVAVCAMQGDGNLVLYEAGPRADWASNTNGNPGSRLVVQDDGNAVIYRANNTAAWATNTVVPSGPTAAGDTMTAGQMLYAGQSIKSQNGKFTFVMQGDGNLVLYRAEGRALWASGTNGKRVAVCAMQGDGNLVLYEAGPHADWASNTNGNPGSKLVVQDDGNVVIYRANGTAAWATNTVQPS